MSRRAFGRALGTFLIAGPQTAHPQRSTIVHRIGRLEPGAPGTPEEVWERGWALRELGWIEGKNLVVERRHANGKAEALKQLAEELVLANVEIIVTGGTAATLAAKRATTTIPIVFRAAGDPVLLGLVESLARPGGNVTGYSLNSPEVIAKYLSLLKELLPRRRRIGILVSAANPTLGAYRAQFSRVSESLGFEPIFVTVAAPAEIEDAVAQLARRQAQALLLTDDTLNWDHRFAIVGAALKHGLPPVAEHVETVREAGALAAFSTTQVEEDRRAASFVDRILRGAKPPDLPVEQPTKFQLVINRKSARMLGLTIPQSLLLSAHEVIE
jgi:putative ABC transport system substrate-binding protein